MALKARWIPLVLATLAGLGCNPVVDPVGAHVGPGTGPGGGNVTSDGTIAAQIESCLFAPAADQPVYWGASAADGGAAGGFIPGAQGAGYLSALPTAPDVDPQEFAEPGVAIIRCPITVAHAGRYTVWVRAYGTSVDANSVYVGLDDVWPPTGRALQICDRPQDFDRWIWTSNQYRSDAEACLGPRAISLDIAAPGAHTLMFSVREEGFRFDAWLLTVDGRYDPNAARATPP